MTHALITTTPLADTGKRQDFGGDTPPDLSHKTTPMAWVPVTPRGARPAYNEATHARPRAGADIVAIDGITETWDAAVELTQAQLDAKAREADVEATRQTMKAAYEKLMDGTATADQVRKVVAWLLKRDGLDLNGEPPAPEPEI